MQIEPILAFEMRLLKYYSQNLESLGRNENLRVLKTTAVAVFVTPQLLAIF